ncbi:hypothetical protein B0H17DRAFT_1154059 [Mycena rosella]|uniref:Uncharacterized protein n=1 Tax=Mycena rosella TaxID=1033263 RepID=A0AAD7F763_MYCRO|nr:hypothetical protein B0H17DRAFT_1154059 [Mycena rosella]
MWLCTGASSIQWGLPLRLAGSSHQHQWKVPYKVYGSSRCCNVPPGVQQTRAMGPKITQKIPWIKQAESTGQEQQTGAVGAQNRPKNPPCGGQWELPCYGNVWEHPENSAKGSSQTASGGSSHLHGSPTIAQTPLG